MIIPVNAANFGRRTVAGVAGIRAVQKTATSSSMVRAINAKYPRRLPAGSYRSTKLHNHPNA